MSSMSVWADGQPVARSFAFSMTINKAHDALSQ